MKPKKITKKLWTKFQNHIFGLLGFDYISYSKVNGRNDLQKIGSRYGSWVVPSTLIDANSICYCVGCGEDVSFDLGLIENFSCNVFAFDPTPRAISYIEKVASQNSKYHFFEVGLWDKEDTLKFYAPRNTEHVSHSLVNLQKTDEYIVVKVKRLKDIMREIGHQKIDLIKIDIEGAEYKVIDSIIEDSIKVKVICIEYDEYFNQLDADYKNRIRDSIIKLLSAGYQLVYAQGNGNYTFVKTTLDIDSF